MFETINQSLFALINASASTSAFIIFIGTIAAKYLIILVAILMLIGWVFGNNPLRRALFSAGLAAIIGLGLNQFIAFFWPYPRPFASGIGQQFLDHAADASFPSDHGTILFSVALALLLLKNRFAIAAVAAALATAWARVFLGVHWPLDMLGSLSVALIAAPLASALLPRQVDTLFSQALKVYQWVLTTLRLPASIFPR